MRHWQAALLEYGIYLYALLLVGPAFVVIAGRAGRHYIGPGVRAAQMSGDHVIYRQASITPPAILSGIIVAAKNFAARQSERGRGRLICTSSRMTEGRGINSFTVRI